MAQAIPVGLGLGQSWASNPNLSAPSGVQNALSHLDPIGNAITKVGGDPLNLYGNKNNPNALLFPSSNPNGANGGVPTTLPSFNIPPNMPGGHFVPVPMGGGRFDAMANEGAGQLYRPNAPRPFVSPAAAPTGQSMGLMAPFHQQLLAALQNNGLRSPISPAFQPRQTMPYPQGGYR